MREIIHLQFGQCGNQIGSQWWKVISEEHALDMTGTYHGMLDVQLEVIETYYHNTSGGRYIPRALLIDLEPGTTDYVQTGPAGTLFRPDNYLCGQSGAGNNWAKGYYTEGAEMADSILDVVRKEAEMCDCLQGFQLCHSLGGGTGSGLGSLMLCKLREEFPDRMLATFSFTPSNKVSGEIANAYNTCLSLHQLIENADQVFFIEDDALADICFQKFGLPDYRFSILNQIAASVMSGATAGFRFPNHLNSNLRALGMNMVPFPRLHFLLLSHAPLIKPTNVYRYFTEGEIFQQLLHKSSVIASCKLDQGKYISAAAIFRGRISAREVDPYPHRYPQCVEWIPHNLKSSTCDISLPGISRSATLIGNHTAVHQPCTRIWEYFSAMFKRKAFLHWYTGEGMDEMEFTEAEHNLLDLISEYQQCAEGPVTKQDKQES